MNEDSEEEEHKKLVTLIRRVAKGLFYELMDEHLSDYEHKRKWKKLVDEASGL
jgi:hypothetical protein